MEQYKNLDIAEMPLGSPYFSDKVSRFLGANGLRMEAMDTYYAVQDSDGNIIAGAGISKDVIKCVAVAEEARSEGLMVPLISRIVAGRGNLKVFTKPEYRTVFESLGFHVLGEAPKAILLENGRGLQQYCDRLRAFAASCHSEQSQKGVVEESLTTGVIVMNANPFTLGHKYLIEKALEQVDHLVVIPVMEDVSLFPYKERLEMICRGVATIKGGDVDVVEGSLYTISAATFPTYFLKDLSEAAEQQMLLDLDIFQKHIAPALGATVRFVGSEPYDPLTARYNALMKERLEVVQISRLKIPDQVRNDEKETRNDEALSFLPSEARGEISASSVRKALAEGDYRTAAGMTPETTHPYLLAALAERALRMELDTPLKPGLVGPDSNGAHKDMDYDTMLRGIKAIRPFFPAIARAKSPEELRQLGIDAENAMLQATGGVNTHRGAIFALGLALAAQMQSTENEQDVQFHLGEIARVLMTNSLKDNDLQLRGARVMALDGYKQLFQDWLPYYRSLRLPVAAGNDGREAAGNDGALQRLLLRVMSTLDDTCIVHRAGEERAQLVKMEAAALLGEIPDQVGNDDRKVGDDGEWKDKLKALCDRYAAENISPGGAADMLSLTIFIDSII
ncbi:MAG: triphosphoribosyl-dephospho-CoA synthase [Bacteroidales bacterium]|nr:triphosphoribosyl-dephospho-CoA synthase [Bacteroidales bacterium]